MRPQGASRGEMPPDVMIFDGAQTGEEETGKEESNEKSFREDFRKTVPDHPKMSRRTAEAIRLSGGLGLNDIRGTTDHFHIQTSEIFSENAERK